MAASKRIRNSDEWVKAGLETLASKGVDAVRVETIAAKLKVTKGSFYWHFTDRDAWLAAMLATWESNATERVIDVINEAGGSAASRLARLMELTRGHPKAPRSELAIRSWGATEKKVSKTLARVDARREAYVRDLLIEHGLPKGEATARAHGLYLALIGEYVWVSHGGPASSSSVWNELVNGALRKSPER